MKKPSCPTCDYVGGGNQAEQGATCPNCGTTLTQPSSQPKTPEPSKPTGFGNERPSSRRKGTGWGN